LVVEDVKVSLGGWRVVQGRSVTLKVSLGWTSRVVSAGTGLYMLA